MRFELTTLRICNPLHLTALPPVHKYKKLFGKTMYILSFKSINTKEDLFHRDVADFNNLNSFMNSLLNNNKNLFFRTQIETTRERDEDNNYVLHTKIGIFKTIQSARSFFNLMTESTDPIRIESRNWNQSNKILSKAEIKDLNNIVVKNLLDCIANTCERFGGICNETNGCSTVPFAKEYAKNKKPFPIKVLVG